MRAANDVPDVHEVSAVSATDRCVEPPEYDVTADSVADAQFVPPLHVTSAVKSVLSVIASTGLYSSRTRPDVTDESAVCAVVISVMLFVVPALSIWRRLMATSSAALCVAVTSNR